MSRDPSRELSAVLDAWVNQAVSVRIVTEADDLVAVFSGTLGPCSNEKSPSAFWPVHLDAAPAELERPGIYAHPSALEDVRVHTGGFVVEFRQAGVTVNVRRLRRAACLVR
jgi:hypothetical protein